MLVPKAKSKLLAVNCDSSMCIVASLWLSSMLFVLLSPEDFNFVASRGDSALRASYLLNNVIAVPQLMVRAFAYSVTSLSRYQMGVRDITRKAPILVLQGWNR